MNGPFVNIYGQAQPDGGNIDAGWLEIMKSAFQQENDVANLMEYVSRPANTPDLNFDFQKAFSGRGLPLDWMPKLAKSVSQQDFEQRLDRIQEEEKAKAVLASSGWAGTAAALGAGILSPTMLLPFSGQAKGLKMIGEAMALSAIGASASEAALFYNQETRTEAESLGSIGLNTLLGGLLGGAFHVLDAKTQLRMERDFDNLQNYHDIPDSGFDIGGGTTRRIYSGESAEAAKMLPQERKLHFDYFRNVPDTKLDAAATPAAKVEPDLAPGFVRVYHSGNEVADGSPRLVSTDRARAAGSREGVAFHYLDLPEADPRVNNLDNPEQSLAKGHTFEFELAPDEAPKMSEIFRGTRREDMPKQPDGMGVTPREEAIPNLESGAEPEDLSAAHVTNRKNVSGPDRPVGSWRNAVMDFLGKMSPLYRMATNKISPTVRDAAFKLDNGGLRQSGLGVLEPSAKGGDVMSRVTIHDKALGTFLQELDRSYLTYVFPGQTFPREQLSAFVLQLKSAIGNLPAGKKSFSEFKEAVYDGLTTGSFDPELAPAVRAFDDFFKYYNAKHNEYHAELLAEGLDVKPLYKELVDSGFAKGEEAYAHQISHGEKIEANSREFDQQISSFFRSDMEASFAKAKMRMQKKKARLEQDLAYMKLSQGDKAQALYDTHAEVKAIEEMPEWAAVNDELKQLRQEARDSGMDPATLKEEQKRIVDSASETFHELNNQRTQLKAVISRMKKLGGEAEAKIAKLEENLAKADSLLEGMFHYKIPEIERLDLSIGKIHSKQDEMFKAAKAKVKEALVALEKRQATYAKLLASKRMNTVSRASALEHLEKTRAKYADAISRLDDASGKNVAFSDALRELDLARRLAVTDAKDLAKARAAKALDAEEKIAEQKAKILTPEEQAAEVEKLSGNLMRLEENFRNSWAARGAVGSDILEEAPDFSEAALREALELRRKYTTGEPVPGLIYARQGERGPQLARMTRIPYSIKKNWLNKDVELVARAFDRQMAPDLELYRAFDGRVNAHGVLEQISRDTLALQYNMTQAKYVKLPKQWMTKAMKFSDSVKNRLDYEGDVNELYFDAGNFSTDPKPGFVELTPEIEQALNKFFTDSETAAMRDFDIAIQRIRHTRMVPADTSSFLWRTGRVAKNLNTVTLMGKVILSSLPDLARPLFKYGVERTVGKAWLPYINNLKSETGKKFRTHSFEINRKLALNLEPLTHGRAQSLVDLGQAHAGGRSVFERGLQFAAHKTGLVAMFDYWTAGMKSMAGNVSHATLSEYIPEVYKAIQSGGEVTGPALSMRTHLRSLGLRDIDIIRIGQMMERPGGMEVFSNGGRLPNLDAWDDVQAFDAYAGAVTRDVNNMILVPGLERPNWVDENLAYSMVAQFKSFMFATNSRVVMSGIQGNDPYLFQGVMFSLAFGAVSYYLNAMSNGGKSLERANKLSPQDWIYESVDRSGLLGVLSYPQQIGEQIPALNQLPIFGGADMAYRRPTGLLGAIFGPSGGQFERMTEFLKNMDSDEMSASRKLGLLRQTFIPYQNHFLFKRMFDRVQEGMATALGDN